MCQNIIIVTQWFRLKWVTSTVNGSVRRCENSQVSERKESILFWTFFSLRTCNSKSVKMQHVTHTTTKFKGVGRKKTNSKLICLRESNKCSGFSVKELFTWIQKLQFAFYVAYAHIFRKDSFSARNEQEFALWITTNWIRSGWEVLTNRDSVSENSKWKFGFKCADDNTFFCILISISKIWC